MRSLKDFTDLLVPLQEAYGQLETKYELQRAMLHEKHAENARLRDGIEAYYRLVIERGCRICLDESGEVWLYARNGEGICGERDIVSLFLKLTESPHGEQQ